MDSAAHIPLFAFPVEILDLIFQELETHELSPVLRANAFFESIAVRVLYRAIPELPIRRCIACLKSLCLSPTHAVLVRRLSIDWSNNRVIANLFRLLRDTLTHLTALRYLSVELSPQDNHYSLAWVLGGLCVSLRSLDTSIRCDPQLARVLGTLPDLKELCLRGFQTKQPFLVRPDAMPRLTSFRTVHAGPALLAEVVRGRPIETVTFSLFVEDGCEPLHALTFSAAPIKRLTIMSLDNCLTPHVLVAEIASRMPSLEALHVVVLMAMFDTVSNRVVSFASIFPRSI